MGYCRTIANASDRRHYLVVPENQVNRLIINDIGHILLVKYSQKL
jgi:hypothetical protein